METNFFEKIPIRNFLVTLRIKQDLSFHYYHGAKLFGFMCRVLEWHPTKKDQKGFNDVVIFPCESGRLSYTKGDLYNFGLTVLRDDDSLIKLLRRNLKNIPDSSHTGDLRRETVELVSFNELPNTEFVLPDPPDNIYELDFITPFRMERPEVDRTPIKLTEGGRLEEKRYFDTEYFDIAHFFKLVYMRIADLYIKNNSCAKKYVVPPIPEVEILEKQFFWLDVPKERPTLGGIIGKIKIKAELDYCWKSVLYLGQTVHAGKNSSFGFGKYIIRGCNHVNSVAKPVKSWFEMTLEKDNIKRAVRQLKEKAFLSGVGLEAQEQFEQQVENNYNSFAASVKNGFYKTADLAGVVYYTNNNYSFIITPNSIKDIILQLAFKNLAESSLDRLSNEISKVYKQRHKNQKAVDTRLLYNDSAAILDEIKWPYLYYKLDAMFYNDPILDILKKWIECDFVFNGIKTKRTKGLARGSILTPGLAKLYYSDL